MLCDTAEERILNTGLFSDRGRGEKQCFHWFSFYVLLLFKLISKQYSYIASD